MGAHSWPSLGDQLAVASALYGNTRCVDSWLAEQFSYVDDLSFARQFSDHISLRGIAPLDYAHRLIETSHGDLLGGIRFYNRDIRRPFVEVIAHSFNDLGAMTDAVAQEWAPFGMYHARLRTSPGRFSGRGVELDQTIHAAPAGRMAGVDPGVELAPSSTPTTRSPWSPSVTGIWSAMTPRSQATSPAATPTTSAAGCVPGRCRRSSPTDTSWGLSPWHPTRWDG